MPRRRLFFFVASVTIFFAVLPAPPTNGQPPKFFVRQVTAGNDSVEVVVRTYGASDYLFCNLHSDENTSVLAADEVLAKRGGRLIELRHSGQRNITFRVGADTFVFDPNRIFTPVGVEKTLADLSTADPAAVKAVIAFGRELISIYDIPKYRYVVALHNNTDERYSVTSYLPGGELAEDAAEVHYERASDADDFFFATDAKLFRALRARRLNVVLQNNDSVTDDGSLSVYCGKLGIPYVNVEAEHGHQTEQIAMLSTLLDILDSPPMQQPRPTENSSPKNLSSENDLGPRPPLPLELVNLHQIDPSFVIASPYATEDNITGTVLYGSQSLFLERSAAERLAGVQRALRSQGLGLKIFDAYRPLSVQRKLWAAKPDTRYVADPAKGSRHNRGSAVDVTLVDRSGRELPMPTAFDEFSEKAHLDFNDLPSAILKNRQTLQSAMKAEGFQPLATEWWHFDAPGWEQFPVSDVNPYCETPDQRETPNEADGTQRN